MVVGGGGGEEYGKHRSQLCHIIITALQVLEVKINVQMVSDTLGGVLLSICE